MFEGFAPAGWLSLEEVGPAGQVEKKGPLGKSRPPEVPLEALGICRRPSHSSERENGDRSDCLVDLTEKGRLDAGRCRCSLSIENLQRLLQR